MISKQRAWDLYDKEMLEVHGINFDAKGIWTEKCVDDEDNGNFIFFDDVILMQSTGLKDKNGKEIFEGDIIDVGNGFINKVDYSLTYGCWRLKSVNGRCLYSYFSNYYSKDEWVIIGNIYENKELLED